MNQIKPCPFCGHVGVHIQEGDTFRWRVAECVGCGARAPEIRINTFEDDRKKADKDATLEAIKEWNTRA